MKAHAQTYTGKYTPEWHDAAPPDIANGRNSGRLRSCSWCGSMHPSDLAAAIQAGARGHWADWKYGWPHKWYVRDIPNPHAGMDEARSTAYGKKPTDGEWEEMREPRYSERTGERVEDRVYWIQRSKAGATTDGKFYTEHLQDATDEEREIIERAMGLRFTFTPDGKVSWRRHEAQAPVKGES
jgi:hypothetical protein